MDAAVLFRTRKYDSGIQSERFECDSRRRDLRSQRRPQHSRRDGRTAGRFPPAGNLTIDAENNATIDAINTSTVTASGGSPFTPDGSATGFNVTIASNYVLASTIASAVNSSLSTSDDGNIDITALGNASINSEMDASTIANTSTIGIVLAFNTVGINEPAAGFLEGTVDALFGTDLASENPDTVEAYASDTTIDAAGGVAVTATDTAHITADVSNSSLAIPQLSSIASGPGVSVGATVSLNHVATDCRSLCHAGRHRQHQSHGYGGQRRSRYRKQRHCSDHHRRLSRRSSSSA